MDSDERNGLIAEGVDPDDLAVRAAIDVVRWELSLLPNAWRLVGDGGPHGP